MAKIVIANIMRAKNKQAFFALHQIYSKIKAIDPETIVEFHIIWDDTNECNYTEERKWADLMEETFPDLHNYTRQFFDNYVKEFYGLDMAEKFKTWKAIYLVLIAHYLRRVRLEHYYLIYDDDILINDDFREVYNVLLTQAPCLISEPMNPSCDKVLFNKLVEIYGEQLIAVYKQQNPEMMGFNAGFQGIDLSLYDDFLSKDGMELLLSLFEYTSVFDADGKEIWGIDRFKIDTQQQSFFGVMNVALTKKPIHILDTANYFVVPNWGEHPIYGKLDPGNEFDGWDIALKSRITHFIGHTQGLSKSPQFLNRMDDYLRNNKFL